MNLIKEFQEEKRLTFTNIIKLWWLNKKIIIIILIFAFVFSLALTFILPSHYSADASIVPPESNNSGQGLSSFLQSMSGGISIGGIGADNKSLLLTEYLQSRELAKYIYDTLKLKDNPIFKDVILVDAYDMIIETITTKANRSGLVLLRTDVPTGYFPNSKDKENAAQLSADIANKAIEGLDYLTRTKNVSKARQKRIYIEKILVDKKIVLDSLDNRLKQFQKDNKVLAIDEQAMSIIESSAQLGSELLKAEHELALKKMDLQPNSNEIKVLEESVKKLRSQYIRIQNGGILGGSDFSAPLSKMPDMFKEYSSIIREKKILEQVNAYLESQKYQEAIQEQSDMPAIEALDKAYVPHKRKSPSRTMAVMLGSIIAMAFTLSIIVYKNVYKNKFILNSSKTNS